MGDLSVESVQEESTNLSLLPLLESSQKLLRNPQINSNVQRAVEDLLVMTEYSLGLHKPLSSNSKKIVCPSDGINQTSNRRKQRIGLNLKKNYVTNIVFNSYQSNIQTSKSSSESLIRKSVTQFCEEYLHEKNVEKSNYYLPNPKVSMKRTLVKVIKKYWMTSPIICKDRTNFVGPKEMPDDVFLATLPVNFSWTLKYFSSYAQIPIGELIDEIVKIENLILHLDQDYFGFKETKKIKVRKK